jgi:hypothetical protein
MSQNKKAARAAAHRASKTTDVMSLIASAADAADTLVAWPSPAHDRLVEKLVESTGLALEAQSALHTADAAVRNHHVRLDEARKLLASAKTFQPAKLRHLIVAKGADLVAKIESEYKPLAAHRAARAEILAHACETVHATLQQAADAVHAIEDAAFRARRAAEDAAFRARCAADRRRMQKTADDALAAKKRAQKIVGVLRHADGGERWNREVLREWGQVVAEDHAQAQAAFDAMFANVLETPEAVS